MFLFNFASCSDFEYIVQGLDIYIVEKINLKYINYEL